MYQTNLSVLFFKFPSGFPAQSTSLPNYFPHSSQSDPYNILSGYTESLCSETCLWPGLPSSQWLWLFSSTCFSHTDHVSPLQHHVFLHNGNLYLVIAFRSLTENVVSVTIWFLPPSLLLHSSSDCQEQCMCVHGFTSRVAYVLEDKVLRVTNLCVPSSERRYPWVVGSRHISTF